MAAKVLGYLALGLNENGVFSDFHPAGGHQSEAEAFKKANRQAYEHWTRGSSVNCITVFEETGTITWALDPRDYVVVPKEGGKGLPRMPIYWHKTPLKLPKEWRKD